MAYVLVSPSSRHTRTPTMQDNLAQLVHAVLRYGLDLQGRLQRGEPADLDAEQALLKDKLLTDFEARRWIEFGGEASADAAGSTTGRRSEPRGDRATQFLGIRYALVCWLDELFTPAWNGKWNEQKLEVELYGSNDRAWRFWEQAKLARTRPTSDALEAFYLCVGLGFRGEIREQPEKLQAWMSHARLRLGNLRELAFADAAELEPPTRVPPLRGRAALSRMIMAGWLTMLAIVPLVAFCLVRRFGG